MEVASAVGVGSSASEASVGLVVAVGFTVGAGVVGSGVSAAGRVASLSGAAVAWASATCVGAATVVGAASSPPQASPANRRMESRNRQKETALMLAPYSPASTNLRNSISAWLLMRRLIVMRRGGTRSSNSLITWGPALVARAMAT